MDKLQQSFDEFLESVLEDEEGNIPLESVDDLLQVDVAIERIGLMKQEIELSKDFMRRKIERTKEWFAKREAKLAKQIEWHELQLGNYLKTNRAKTGSNRVSTEAGRASLRSVTPEYIWDDEKAVEFLEASGHIKLIRIKKAPDKTAIKKAFNLVDDKLVSDEGEVMEGVQVLQKDEEKVIVSFNK